MKKIFTLFFAMAIFIAADAQRGNKNKKHKNNKHNNGKNIVINNGRYGNNDYNSRRNMQWEIARINREYDHKIEHIRNDHHVKRNEKRRKISILEQKRQQEIRRVYARNNNNRDNRIG